LVSRTTPQPFFLPSFFVDSLFLLFILISYPALFRRSRGDSNTQFDFARFILSAVAEGALAPGNPLAMDNAAVHCGAEVMDLVYQALDAVGVDSVGFLPAFLQS
jgi:hypothetical protein